MERKPHPSKQAVLIIGGAVLLGGIVIAVFLAATVQNKMLAYVIAGAIVVSDTVAFLFISQAMLKNLTCPTCNQPLERDPRAYGEKEYPCQTCDTVWVG